MALAVFERIHHLKLLALPLLIGLSLIPVFVGCSVKVVREDLLVTMPPPKSSTDEIAMFAIDESPPCPFEEIGLVSSVKGTYVPMGRVKAALREAARKMGGDAIINLKIGHVESNNMIHPANRWNPIPKKSKNSVAQGTVVRWLDASCAQQQHR